LIKMGIIITYFNFLWSIVSGIGIVFGPSLIVSLITYFKTKKWKWVVTNFFISLLAYLIALLYYYTMSSYVVG